MNLLSLKYYIAIAEHASFTRAAEALYVTQPTLSRQIADLEEEMGVQLFERSKWSIEMTEAGNIFLREARDIVERCDHLTDMMKQSKEDVRGTLNIGYQGTMDNRLLHNTLKAMTGKYPHLDLSIFRCNFNELNYFLMNRKFDLIYTLTMIEDSLPEVETERICDNKLNIVVPVKHRLASRNSVHVRDLVNERFVMLERKASPLTVDFCISLCQKNGFSPNVVQYTSDGQTLLYMVGYGKGIGFLFSHVSVPNPEDVRILSLEGYEECFDMVMAYRKDNKNPAINVMIEETREQLHNVDVI